MIIINGCSVSQLVWHVKEPSLLNGHECRAKLKIFRPSPAMVTSPNEWKKFEWDEKLQIKKTKKTNKYEYLRNKLKQPYLFTVSILSFYGLIKLNQSFFSKICHLYVDVTVSSCKVKQFGRRSYFWAGRNHLRWHGTFYYRSGFCRLIEGPHSYIHEPLNVSHHKSKYTLYWLS